MRKYRSLFPDPTAAGTAVVVAAQGTCYVGADCSNLGTAEAKASYEECCLQNGTTPLSFKPDGGSGVCSECIGKCWRACVLAQIVRVFHCIFSRTCEQSL